jgi:hypothetical protein
MKKCQNDENGRRHCGGRRRRCIVSPAAKPSTQFPSKRLWLCPSRFSSQKVAYCRPRAGFCGGAKKRIPLAPHSETFNGNKGVKTIRKPFYSPNTATADLFLFQRGEVEAGRPLTVPGRPDKELGGGCPNQQQK